MRNSRKYLCTIQVFKLGNDNPILIIDPGWGPSNVLVAAKSDEPYHIAAFITSDRKILIYNADSNLIIYKGHFEGSGSIMSVSFNGPYLILNTIRNNVTRIKCDSVIIEIPSSIGNHAYPPS